MVGCSPTLAGRDCVVGLLRPASASDPPGSHHRHAVGQPGQHGPAAVCRSAAPPARCLRSMKRQTLGRIGRVQRHIGPARLEIASSPTTISRLRSTQSATRLSGPDPQRPQMMRQPVGPGVQLAHSSAARSSTHHRNRVRCPRRLRLEQLMDAHAPADSPPPSRSTRPATARARPASSSASSVILASGVGDHALRAVS